MSYSVFKAVDFGPAKGGLSSIGYTLTGGSRVTIGVAEVGTATGIYGATVTFADAFSGSILWDTGEGASTVFAAEAINPECSGAFSPTPAPTQASCPVSLAAGTEAITEALVNPRRVSGDAGSVEGHSLPDLIAADKYLNAKATASSPSRGLRFNVFVPDGTANARRRCGGNSGFGFGPRQDF